MIRTLEIEGFGTVKARLPRTVREVLEYRVFIQSCCYDGGPNGDINLDAFRELAEPWARRYVDAETFNGLDESDLAALCSAICTAAEPPQWVCEDLKRRLMTQEKVSKDDIDMFESCFDDASMPTTYAAQIAFAVSGESALDIDLPPWAWSFAAVANEVRGMVYARDRRRRKNFDSTMRIAQNYGLPELPN